MKLQYFLYLNYFNFLTLSQFFTIEIGWRANFSPADHPVSQYEFDVLIGADGKRNTLEGIHKKKRLICLKKNLNFFDLLNY